jgi:CxxC motif-containing protein
MTGSPSQSQSAAFENWSLAQCENYGGTLNMNNSQLSITCISCPMGCPLTVTIDSGNITDVSGAVCKKGIAYAELECTNPTRMVTSTVTLIGSHLRRLPIKTERAIPKHKIAECVRSLKGVEIKAPVAIGDVVVENICDTGINMVATRHA